MNEITFNSIDELYIRVLPALKSKKLELKNNGFKYIEEIDIWNCIRKAKWINSTELTLSDIVDDILNFANEQIIEYCTMKNNKKDEVELNIELPKLKDDNRSE